MEKISPKYLMNLIKEIDKAIWAEYKSYKEVRQYIEKWHIIDDSDWNYVVQNFEIKYRSSGDIDLFETLHGIKDDELFLRLAVDLGVDTPDFIPSVTTFRNEIKSDYKTAVATFDKAHKQIEISPDIAIGLANSALESVLKEILKDDRIQTKSSSKYTLYDLASCLLKEFKLYPQSDLPDEIKIIGSSLLSAAKAIEGLRSTSTLFHGKTNNEYVVDDSIYTYFVVNSVTTVGLFLNSFYKNKFPIQVAPVLPEDDDLPF